MSLNEPGAGSTRLQPLTEDDPVQVGDYRLRARIGSGGMGRVYLAYTPGGRAVAVKVVRQELGEDEDFRRRFRQEVRAAARVDGLFTAPVLDSDTEAPRPWLVTSYVPGPSLSQAVARYGALPLESALLLVAGIAEALQSVHGAGIVHRDLKPSNVLLAADGPRVIDFGIARAAEATALTASGHVVGTPSFMSPEQATGGRTVGPESDIFTLGQIAAFAVTGAPAFGEGSVQALLYRVVHEPPSLSDIPEPLHDLVSRCLAKDPADRPTLTGILAACREAVDATELRRPEHWLPAPLAAALPQDPPREPTDSPAPPAPEAKKHDATPDPDPDPDSDPDSKSTPGPESPSKPDSDSNEGDSNEGDSNSSESGPKSVPVPPSSPSGPARSPERHKPLLTVAVCTALALAAGTGYAFGPGSASDGPTWISEPQAEASPGADRTHTRAPETGADATTDAEATEDGTSGSRADTPAPADEKGAGGPHQEQAPGPPPHDPTRPSRKPPEKPPREPGPSVKGTVRLPKGWHVNLDAHPLKPTRSGTWNKHEIDFRYHSGRLRTRDGNRLALLAAHREGSLRICRRQVTFTQNIDVARVGPGRQICVFTRDGHAALVTLRKPAPSTHATFTLTVWRNAANRP